MKYTLSTIFLLVCTIAFAQDEEEEKEDNNLVENGGFEEYEGKLKKDGQIELAAPWSSPTLEGADLYSTEANKYPEVSAPDNVRGRAHAKTGNNYAGANFYSYNGKESRSYLKVKFKKQMEKGQRYCVKFNVSLSDYSKYAIDKVQAYVTNSSVDKETSSNLIYKAQIPAVSSNIIEDMYDWQGVCGIYTSKGFEYYLMIGNFSSGEETNYKKMKRPKGLVKPQQYNAYYFVDDVSVTPIESKSECSCSDEPDPGSDYIYDKKLSTDKTVPVAERIGRVGIYYKLYRSSVDPVMQPLLNEVAQLLEENPEIKVRLVGHIDVNEEDKSKVQPDMAKLGERRANFVKAYLKTKGISEDRITVTDAGASDHADTNEGLIPDAKNRRVSFEIVE